MQMLDVEQIDDWLAYKILVNAQGGPIDWKDYRIQEQERHMRARLADIPSDERKELIEEHQQWVRDVEAYEGEPW